MTSNVTLAPDVTEFQSVVENASVSTWISVTGGAQQGDLALMTGGILLLMSGGSLLLV